MYLLQKVEGVEENNIVKIESIRDLLFLEKKDMTEEEYNNLINTAYEKARVSIKVIAPNGTINTMQYVNDYARVHTLQDLSQTGIYKIEIKKDGELWGEYSIEYNQSQRYYLTYNGGFNISIYDTQTNSIVKADKIYVKSNEKEFEIEEIDEFNYLYKIFPEKEERPST